MSPQTESRHSGDFPAEVRLQAQRGSNDNKLLMAAMAEEAPVGRTVLAGRLSAKSVIWRALFRLPLIARSSPSPLRQTKPFEWPLRSENCPTTCACDSASVVFRLQTINRPLSFTANTLIDRFKLLASKVKYGLCEALLADI